MKSGTTLLWRLLASHPDIYMCSPKEPCYFVDPEQLRAIQRFIWKDGYWRSLDRYLELFGGHDERPYRGEASVFYTYLPRATGVVDRLSRFNPEARLIYIMRDPVQRTLSHYWHHVINNNEHRPLSHAITQDNQYCEVSHYAMQLSPYFDKFDRNQIYTLTFEELFEKPNETVNSIFRWLGLHALAVTSPLSLENSTPDLIRQPLSWWARMKRFSERYDLEDSYIRMRSRVPEEAKERVSGLLYRTIKRTEINIEPVVRELKLLQKKQTDELSKLLGRDFKEWTTLYS